MWYLYQFLKKNRNSLEKYSQKHFSSLNRCFISLMIRNVTNNILLCILPRKIFYYVSVISTRFQNRISTHFILVFLCWFYIKSKKYKTPPNKTHTPSKLRIGRECKKTEHRLIYILLKHDPIVFLPQPTLFFTNIACFIKGNQVI